MNVNPASSIMTAMEAETETGKDMRKSNLLMRQLHSNKKVAALDNSIGQMKKQQSELKQAANKGFIFGMISNFLQIAKVVICALFPAAAPLISKIMDIVQPILNTVSQKLVSKDQLSAQDAQIKSETLKNAAEKESKLYAQTDERIQDDKQNAQTIKSRLEAALNNVQQGNSAAVRV
ncbi:MAG: hypothetical protein ACD_73C00690G0002 [uncultured bacterium]|nr:MAG: hypothetical protein ACD_73C00690G0002 [uncultured bacterium]